MRIHEYQAKEIFAKYGLPVAPSRAVSTVDDAVGAAGELDYPVAVKAQIHAGGRGKGGGIVIAQDEETLRETATCLLSHALVTSQTGPDGRVVRKLLIEKAAAIAEERYLAVTVDRARRSIVIVASRTGGIDIEEVARENPEAILKEWIDPAVGLRPFQAHRLARKLALPVASVRPATELILTLYRFFCREDCTLAEINPLAITEDAKLVAIDAKVAFDDSGLFRHPETAKLRDETEEDPVEVEASAVNLNYIKLDGNVGCLVNGAGLAMATMDLIDHVGARPANFLDVGGGATAEMIEKGVRILVGDPDVQAVLINIFGGILRCDVLAEGVVAAVKAVDAKCPVIIRLEGTNVDAGREILRSSGLSFRTASDLREAAQMIGDAVKEAP